MNTTLRFVCLMTLGNLLLFAQTGSHPRTTHTAEKSAIHLPAAEPPKALKKIYSNLGSKTAAFNDTEGWVLSGPNSGTGFTEFMAMPFTPKANSTLEQVQIAVQYVSGANQVNVSVYGDASGSPGTLLAGPVTVTNLPAFGTCCTLAVASFSPLSLTGGTRYWVTVDTPSTGTGSDFDGVWDWPGKPLYPQARNKGAGWTSLEGSPAESAGAVFGTVP